MSNFTYSKDLRYRLYKFKYEIELDDISVDGLCDKEKYLERLFDKDHKEVKPPSYLIRSHFSSTTKYNEAMKLHRQQMQAYSEDRKYGFNYCKSLNFDLVENISYDLEPSRGWGDESLYFVVSFQYPVTASEKAELKRKKQIEAEKKAAKAAKTRETALQRTLAESRRDINRLKKMATKYPEVKEEIKTLLDEI